MHLVFYLLLKKKIYLHLNVQTKKLTIVCQFSKINFLILKIFLVCIEKIIRFLDKELILITFFNQLIRGSKILLQIKYFKTELSNNNPALVLQQPLKWERDRAWIIGTYNPQILINKKKNHLLQSVFPEIASYNNNKIVFKLCLSHPKNAFARSNAPKNIVIETAIKTTTCFEETPKILIENFAFIIFDNMRLISSEKNIVEVFIGKHLSINNSQWIFDETIKVKNISYIKF